MAATSPLSTPLHTGADADEDEDILKHLGPCAKPYLALQDCLISTNRNWMTCQSAVKLLKACHEGNKKEDAT
eukprot:c17729_g1_i1 orf=97-312(+)